MEIEGETQWPLSRLVILSLFRAGGEARSLADTAVFDAMTMTTTLCYMPFAIYIELCQNFQFGNIA